MYDSLVQPLHVVQNVHKILVHFYWIKNVGVDVDVCVRIDYFFFVLGVWNEQISTFCNIFSSTIDENLIFFDALF